MKYRIEIDDYRQLANIEAALKIVDPAAEIDMEHPDLRLMIDYTPTFYIRIFSPDLPAATGMWEIQDHDILDSRYQLSYRAQRLKELIRLGIINLVGGFLNQKPPWGILSAVRPTKIFHHLREDGFSIAEIREKFLTIYQLTPELVELLIEVGSKQEKYFKAGKYISVYVGIPFCPTRCQYCSFPAVSLENHQHWVKGFLEALQMEIKATRDLINEYGLLVETIYVGGGTPTCLDSESFNQILTMLSQYFKTSDTIEFTVEAGRPETVTLPKLQAMVNTGVTRVCINPQTMDDQTLIRIGRRHTVADLLAAVQMVKNNSDLALNMDLILGLPGEDGNDFLQSLANVMILDPEAITIHTLAPKRAAAWRKTFNTLQFADPANLSYAFQQTLTILGQNKYYPYYLYRQRFILANQANVGFSKPGYESVYNIQMMEERQTIFGLGGGAITKWIFGPENRVVRLQNPKCPATYRNLITEQIVKKAQQTRLLLG